MVDVDVLLEQVGSMPLKYSVWSNFVFLLVLATGAPAGSEWADDKKCSIQASKEVHMGSSFSIYCVFKKECKIKIYQDKNPLPCSSCNSTHVRMNVVNLTRTTTFTCKCSETSEPCGTDITPGYPPELPQNLTCVQEGELGNVSCTWEVGRETYIQTTSRLRVCGDPPRDYASVALRDGTLSAIFPIPDTQTNFSALVTATNSLGSVTSDVHSFMLNDIVKPLSPIIKKVECSSRQCQLYPESAQSIQLVEIQYGTDEGSWNITSFNHTNSSTSWTVTSLYPYSLYTFQVRWKLSPNRGLWSEWSKVKKRTDEEAPAAMVDAWYVEETMQTVSKPIHLFWKNLSISEARGQILGYNVTVMEKGKTVNTTFIKPQQRDYSIPSCSCNVNIFAVNSKGQSPVRLIQLQPIDDLSFAQLPVLHKPVNNDSIALSWPRLDSAQTVTEYLVEWYPAGRKRSLQWIRVGRHLNTTNLTGLQPTECYDGAVIYLLPSGAKRAVFSDVSTWQSAPQQGPGCNVKVKNDEVEVSWDDIPPDKTGGCLIRYTISLQEIGGQIKNYSVLPTQREYTITGLTLGQQYQVWVSAKTEVGEGPKGHERNFRTHLGVSSAEKPLAMVVSIGGVVFLTCLSLLCICQFSSVHRRLSRCCHCLMPSIVPDPANSKWAKECASEKGEMKVQLYLSDSSMSEEEPDTVEVQELPREKLLQEETVPVDREYHSGVSSLNVLDQEHHEPSSPYQPITTSSYLKSLSNSSDTTQASRNTDISVDYISTHGVMSGEEDDEEEDTDMMGFFPCPTSPFLDPQMSVGGKLTLDIVKIDCSDLNLCIQ